MIIAPETFLLFLGAVMILLITPGPNMAFVLTSGAAYGWRGGFAAAAGIGVVDLVFTLVCAFGLAGLLQAYPAAFDAIRWAGAAYLIWLAVTCIRSAGRAKATGTSEAEPSRPAIFVRGIASNIANPKAILFFLVFIPQFIDAGSGSVFAQFVILGAALAVIGTVFHGSLGAIGAAGAALAGEGAKRKRGLHYLQAAVFAAIAGRLLLGQPKRPVMYSWVFGCDGEVNSFSVVSNSISSPRYMKAAKLVQRAACCMLWVTIAIV